jgi:octaprenyl-diphosphate synthase
VSLCAAVELVHAATLLHDDVIDTSDLRRGDRAARLVYGNSASVLGGDVLMLKASATLVEAGRPELFRSLVRTMEELVAAEDEQLANRGRLLLDEETYLRIIGGKTAALFRWACAAGGSAAGRPAPEIRALERYGDALGVAFQIADDVLDATGDPTVTGKAILGDLREGKATFPLIAAARLDTRARDTLAAVIASGKSPEESGAFADLIAIATRPECIRAANAKAVQFARQAEEALNGVNSGPAKHLLLALANAAAVRNH